MCPLGRHSGCHVETGSRALAGRHKGGSGGFAAVPGDVVAWTREQWAERGGGFGNRAAESHPDLWR